MKTEAEIREELAPKIAVKILGRLRGQPVTPAEAEQLAHEILAVAGAAFLGAQSGPNPPEPEN